VALRFGCQERRMAVPELEGTEVEIKKAL